MFRDKASVFVLVMMVIAGLFGCQCGGAPKVNVGPGAGQDKKAAGDNAGADPGEKAAFDLVEKFGNASVEGGHVVGVNIFKKGFKDADIKTLATLPKVRKISIVFVDLSGSGLKDLAGLKELTELDIGQNPITDAGIKEVAALTQLKKLRIAGAKASEATLRELATLTQLEELNLDGNGYGANAGVNVAAALPKLKRLEIGNNSDLGDVGLAAIANNMHELQVLHTIGTRVTDKGLAVIPTMKKLEDFSFGPPATDGCMKYIAACNNLRKLRFFNTHVSDKGLRELNALTNLENLNIQNGVFGKVSDQGIAEFRKTHPNCKVDFR